MKLGIVVGHEKKKPGATLKQGENLITEYEYNTVVAALIEKNAKGSSVQTKTFFRDGVGIVKAHKAAEDWGANVVIELHFNSFPDASVKGSEVLCAQNTNNNFAQAMSRAMSQLFRGPDRGGTCPFDIYTNGWYNVNRPVPTFLLEPFFASNIDQASIASVCSEAYAILILKVIKEFYP